MEIKYETYEELLRGEIEAERYEEEIKFLISKAELGFDKKTLRFDDAALNLLCERLFPLDYKEKLDLLKFGDKVKEKLEEMK